MMQERSRMLLAYTIKVDTTTLNARETRSEITLEFMKRSQSRRLRIPGHSKRRRSRSRDRRWNCSYRRRYRETSTFPRDRNGDGVFRLRNRFLRECRVIAGKEEVETRFADRSCGHVVFSHTLSRKRRTPELVSGWNPAPLCTVSYICQGMRLCKCWRKR